jgi:hypothetical protein
MPIKKISHGTQQRREYGVRPSFACGAGIVTITTADDNRGQRLVHRLPCSVLGGFTAAKRRRRARRYSSIRKRSRLPSSRIPDVDTCWFKANVNHAAAPFDSPVICRWKHALHQRNANRCLDHFTYAQRRRQPSGESERRLVKILTGG